MKNIYLPIAFLFILFVGCFTTYNVSDFTSKQKFYEEINNTLKETSTKVILANDSTLFAEGGVHVKEQQLTCYSKVVDKRPQQIALSELASVEFESENSQSAGITFKSGEEFLAENVVTIQDTIHFTEVRNLTKISTFPLDKVKSVRYNNLWKSISAGGMIGITSLSLLGYFMGKNITQQVGGHSENRESQELEGFVGGFIYGAVIGAISGFFWDYPVIYEFNNQ